MLEITGQLMLYCPVFEIYVKYSKHQLTTRGLTTGTA